MMNSTTQNLLLIAGALAMAGLVDADAAHRVINNPQRHLNDDAAPSFQALSYVRSAANLRPRRRRVKRRTSDTPWRAIPQFDPNAPQPPTLPPTFENFNEARPENDGNCVQAMNRERQAAGQPELILNDVLSNLAAKHSAYMAASQTTSHDGFWSFRFDAVPSNVSGVGEVVTADTMMNAPNGPAKKAVDRWMASPEHKTLLLRPDLVMMGCSTTEGRDGRFYATGLVASRAA